MPEPLNVLRVITWLPAGGIEKKILAVLPRLNPQRFRPRVLCLRERGALADDLERAGIPVDLIPFRSRLDPGAIARLVQYLRRHKIDLVHAHMYRAAVPCAIAGRLAGVPAVVSQVHNVGTWETARQVWLDRFLCRWRKRIVAVSECVRRDVIETLRVDPSFVRVIYNGVDFTEFYPADDAAQARAEAGFPAQSKVVLMAARLVKQKNPFGFLEMARRLAPDFPDVVFAIAGGGPLEARVREEAAKSGLGEQFRVLGFCDNMSRLYRAADLFVLPSRKEGFANALVEGMACGVPAVATDVGGAAEALDGGAAGRLIPPDNQEALETAVAALLQDDSGRRALAQRALARAQLFSLENMIRDVEALYEEMLAVESAKRNPARG